MAKKIDAKKAAGEIREGDWLDFRLQVAKTLPDGRVVVEINDAGGIARKVTVREDSDEIVGRVNAG